MTSFRFYSMAGDGDGASSTVEAYERDLPGAAESVTSENFTAQVVSGNHNYPTVTIGLYNFLRIAFGIVPAELARPLGSSAGPQPGAPV